MNGASRVRSSIRFLNSWLQIAVEWLHERCHVVLPCAYRDAGWRRDVTKGHVMAASRCLSGEAASEIEHVFSAEHGTSYWNGCMKASMVICQ